MKYLIFLLLVGCSEAPKKDLTDYKVPGKLCIDNCLRHTFSNFHANGNSWGTGSSSMNGLSQPQIFDRVYKYCEDFYKDTKCCRFNHQYGDDKNINWIHGTSYGECLK